jgi:hypothetical protein
MRRPPRALRRTASKLGRRLRCEFEDGGMALLGGGEVARFVVGDAVDPAAKVAAISDAAQ